MKGEMKMSVAKSYEKYELLDEPYKKDGRAYVHISYPCCKRKACTKCGGAGAYSKEVRWYGEVKVSTTTSDGFNARAAFLFGEKGFIIIFKGNEEDIENYFLNSLPRHYGRFNTLFGWFIGAETAIPTSLPSNITPVCLKWEEVSTNNVINNYDDIRAYVGEKLYGKVKSHYVGAVGDKVDLHLFVLSTKTIKGFYGEDTLHIFEDADSNRYSWKTSARKLEVDEIYHLKGTIKEHIKIDGAETTVLTRCREV